MVWLVQQIRVQRNTIKVCNSILYLGNFLIKKIHLLNFQSLIFVIESSKTMIDVLIIAHTCNNFCTFKFLLLLVICEKFLTWPVILYGNIVDAHVYTYTGRNSSHKALSLILWIDTNNGDLLFAETVYIGEVKGLGKKRRKCLNSCYNMKNKNSVRVHFM